MFFAFFSAMHAFLTLGYPVQFRVSSVQPPATMMGQSWRLETVPVMHWARGLSVPQDLIVTSAAASYSLVQGPLYPAQKLAWINTPASALPLIHLLQFFFFLFWFFCIVLSITLCSRALRYYLISICNPHMAQKRRKKSELCISIESPFSTCSRGRSGASEGPAAGEKTMETKKTAS